MSVTFYGGFLFLLYGLLLGGLGLLFILQTLQPLTFAFSFFLLQLLELGDGFQIRDGDGFLNVVQGQVSIIKPNYSLGPLNLLGNSGHGIRSIIEEYLILEIENLSTVLLVYDVLLNVVQDETQVIWVRRIVLPLRHTRHQEI